MKRFALVPVLLLAAAGCHATVEREVVVERRPVVEREIVVEEAPPPTRVEVITVRPHRNAVWVGGHYVRSGHQRVWVSGHWS